MARRIHLVEDDPGIRFLLDYYLRKEGFHIQVSASIKCFAANHDIPPDLYLIDIMVPDGNGIDLCRQLKSNDIGKKIPVILMSAHMPSRAQLESSGAEDFVSKPFDLLHLRSTIDKHLASSLPAVIDTN